MLESIEKEATKITSWFQDYKEPTDCHVVLIVLSDGKDSTIVIMFGKKAWGECIFCCFIPSRNQVDLDDAIEVAKTCHLEPIIVNMNDISRFLIDLVNDSRIIDRIVFV